MAFVNAYGKGRVFHCVLGHDVGALSVQGRAGPLPPRHRLGGRAAAHGPLRSSRFFRALAGSIPTREPQHSESLTNKG